MTELVNSLAEGFMADSIVNNRDFTRAQQFVDSVKEAKKAIRSKNPIFDNESLRNLHNYNRFTKWLIKEYGTAVFRSIEDIENFIDTTLDSIAQDTVDFEKFWKHMQLVTLEEGSSYTQS